MNWLTILLILLLLPVVAVVLLVVLKIAFGKQAAPVETVEGEPLDPTPEQLGPTGVEGRGELRGAAEDVERH
jgi:hypothetical protein